LHNTSLKNESALVNRTREASKTYSFTNTGNPRIISEHWFQNTPEGKTLFLVFYTQACSYSKCTGCSLPSRMSEYHIGYKDLIMQVKSVFHHILSQEEKDEINKIIISNNGSVLDEKTFSTTALIYLISAINLECKNTRVISLETRPEYVEIEELEVIARALIEGDTPSALELAIGVEAFDEEIRNKRFNKGLDLVKIESMAEMLNSINLKFEKKYPSVFKKMKMKAYFMLKPVTGMTDEEAVEDIKNGIEYLHKLSLNYNIGINMHLNPTYVAKGTILEDEFKKGHYIPPTLELVKEAVLFAEDKKITIYIGLNDEGLAVNGGSFIRENEKDRLLVCDLEKFNSTLDFNLLKQRYFT
jgi:radical SAM enzyme (TIGR01210 family)